MKSLEIAEHLQRILVTDSFRNGTIAGAEVPYFICPYLPTEHVHMQEVPARLVTYLAHHSINALNIDLFALCVTILQDEGIWEDVLEQEHELPKEALGSTLTNVIGNGAAIIQKINQLPALDTTHILMLSNIGACYPFLRAHALLNHLYALRIRIPILIFFPGTYGRNASSTMALNLFGTLHDNHYYRALNILDVK